MLQDKTSNFYLSIVVLAAIYSLFGITGLALTSSAGHATAIFPSSGIAFIAVLYFGNRILPGVWLGSIVINLWVSSDITLNTLSIAMCIAIGSSLQAWLAAYLINCRSNIDWRQLTANVDIGYFLLLGGPIACLVSASWGSYTLLFFDIISINEFTHHWLNWWLGDVGGVILFSPLALLFLLRNNQLWQIRQRFVAVPTLIVIVIVTSAYLYFSDQSFLAWKILFLGIVLTSLLQILLLTITGYYHTALAEVNERSLLVQNSEKKYRTLINASPFSIQQINTNGQITAMNPAGLQMFNFQNESEVIGTSYLSIIADEYKERILTLLKRVYTGHYSEFEFKGNGDIHYLSNFSPIYDHDGMVSHALSITQDITKRKLMKDDLIEAKELAEHASQAKSEFLSSMSHELHTPLGVILGFAELLQADNLTEDQHDNVSYILSSGHHLLELVDQVLKLSSMEAGSTELLFEPVEVVIILEEVIVLLSPMAHKANIQIHLLSDLTVAVNADYTGLKQIIINLVTNAIKYNHHGGSVSIDWQQTEDNNVKISIIDTGTGIAEANKENVFTAFNRLGKETSNIEGTGIGLIITKNLVEMMNGKIGFESAENKGATFWFELPIA